jgi:hypothetical protein
MAAEDRNGEVSTLGGCTDCSDTTREHSFDELAKSLANGKLSRRSILRMLGGVLLGGALASIPGVAWAQRDIAGIRSCPPGAQLRCGRECCEDFTRTCVMRQSRPQCVCEAGKIECGGPSHRCCFPSFEVCVNGECTCPPETTICGEQAADNFDCCSEESGKPFCCSNDPFVGPICCETPCCGDVCCNSGQTCVDGQCTCTQGITCGIECCRGPDDVCCEGDNNIECCKAALGQVCHPEFGFCTTFRECPTGVEYCPPGVDCGTRFLCTPAGECCTDGTVMTSGECCPSPSGYCQAAICDEFGNCTFCEQCCPEGTNCETINDTTVDPPILTCTCVPA